MLYVMLGHRIANSQPAPGRPRLSGIDQLGAAMLVAAVAATPVGLPRALPAFAHPAGCCGASASACARR